MWQILTTVECRISSQWKWYKNYKNRLRLAKVIIRNKMSRFLWFSAVQPVTTCLQSPYLHKPAIVIVTSFSLWRHSHILRCSRRSHYNVTLTVTSFAITDGRTLSMDTLPHLIYRNAFAHLTNGCRQINYLIKIAFDRLKVWLNGIIHCMC